MNTLEKCVLQDLFHCVVMVGLLILILMKIIK